MDVMFTVLDGIILSIEYDAAPIGSFFCLASYTKNADVTIARIANFFMPLCFLFRLK